MGDEVRGMPIVYADVLVALNWVIDFLLLSATALFLHIPLNRVRVTLSSLIGGLYALVLLLPRFSVVIRFSLDVLFAVLMTATAFPRCRIRILFKRTAVFFGISTMFFGVVTLLHRYLNGEYVQTNNGQVYAALSPLALAGFTVISYVAVRVFETITGRRVPKHGEYRLTVVDDAATCEARALFDSGMRLREPFSGAPVIVMERERVWSCLSRDMREALTENEPHPRVRFVPYHTVSGEGLLPAFRPRSVQVKRWGEEACDVSGVYVALCERLGRDEYEALINEDCCGGWDR